MGYTLCMRLSFCLFFFSMFFFLLVAVPFSFGQQVDGYDAYDVLLSEVYPSPGEFVDLTIQSNKSLSPGIRSVRWHVDGVERRDYRNKLKLTEIAGSSPKQVTVFIHYFDVFGEKRYTEIFRRMRPVIFDILWEADSVVTPLYRGHRLAGPQVPVKISAKIQYTDQNGITYTEKDFSFRWLIESRYYGDRGPGASRVVYEEGGNYFNRYIIVKSEATLMSDNNVDFEKIINIPVVRPRLLVYPHTLLYGLFRDRVLSRDLSFESERVTASVYPFYFSLSDFEKNAIQYRWFVNNQTNHLKEGRKLDISIEGEKGVSIPVRIVAQNENEDLQQADITFSFRL